MEILLTTSIKQFDPSNRVNSYSAVDTGTHMGDLKLCVSYQGPNKIRTRLAGLLGNLISRGCPGWEGVNMWFERGEMESYSSRLSYPSPIILIPILLLAVFILPLSFFSFSSLNYRSHNLFQFVLLF